MQIRIRLEIEEEISDFIAQNGKRTCNKKIFEFRSKQQTIQYKLTGEDRYRPGLWNKV